jgi:TonB family protein
MLRPSGIGAAAALLASAAGAQTAGPSARGAVPADTFSAAGRAIGRGGERIAGARVRLASQPELPGVMTGADGSFRIDGVRGAGDSLIVRRLGYRPDTIFLSRQVDVGAGLVVALEQVPLRLAPVRVAAGQRVYTGPFAAFHRRRDRGFGNFLTRDQIAARRAPRTSDLFRSVVNMNVERSGGSNIVRMRGRRCDPLVWFDGQPLVGGFPDLDAISPESIEGIEIYSGVATIPPELMGPRDAGGCGVIVVWTRHGEPRARRQKPVTAAGLMSLVDAGQAFLIDQVDVPATPLAGFEAAPEYPETLKAEGATGAVIAEFVVNADGRVDDPTIGVIAASHVPFADAVRRALPLARFNPATRGGETVRQVVQQSFLFDPQPVAAANPAPPRRP